MVVLALYRGKCCLIVHVIEQEIEVGDLGEPDSWDSA